MDINYAKVLDIKYPELEYTIKNNQYVYEDIEVENKPSESQLRDDWVSIERTMPNWVAFEKERNLRLAATDHFGLSDQTMTPEMADYRQALRDIPLTQTPKIMEDLSLNIDWPDKPE